MSTVILIVGSALGDPCREAGQYLQAYSNYAGRGIITTTLDKARALRFADLAAALAFWKQTNETHPLRPDGKPNRPLTAFTVTFESIEA